MQTLFERLAQEQAVTTPSVPFRMHLAQAMKAMDNAISSSTEVAKAFNQTIAQAKQGGVR